jgi:hypothetical protein
MALDYEHTSAHNCRYFGARPGKDTWISFVLGDPPSAGSTPSKTLNETLTLEPVKAAGPKNWRIMMTWVSGYNFDQPVASCFEQLANKDGSRANSGGVG